MLYLPLPEGTYRITQGFGLNKQYYKKYNLDGHNGYDLAPLIRGNTGVTVFAPHEGYVSLGDEGKLGYGRHVEILSRPYNNEGHRKKSTLAHLASFLVKDGQYVGSGDPIGYMGSTGDSTNVHLHFTYKVADKDGYSMHVNNGYKGALPVAKYVLKWVLDTLA